MKLNSPLSQYSHLQTGLMTKKYSLIIGCLMFVCLIILQLTESSNEEDFLFHDASISNSEQLQLHDLNSQLALLKMSNKGAKNLYRSQNESLTHNPTNTPSHFQREMGGLLILSNLVDQNASTLSQDSYIHQQWPMIAPLIQESALKYPISSHFGYRLDPISHLPAIHHGVDFLAPVGTPIIATADGMIIKSGQTDGYGLSLEIQHANGFKSKYAHASLLQVKVGDEVKQGQVIAFVGNSGRSTGAHLHYEILVSNKPIDPFKLMK
jgi:hypothetical protein